MQKEQIWFITGAGSGLGAGTAKAALEKGHKVVATARNMEKLRKALPGAPEERLLFLPLDVTNEKQVSEAICKAVEKFGRIDVLMNNAGYSLGGLFEAYTHAQFEQQLATNLYGPAHTMKAALPFMRKQRSGHIINVSSVAGVVGLKTASAYCASKFGLEGLSLAIGEEVKPFGIKMTIVEPGYFRTDLLDANNAKLAISGLEDYKEEVGLEEMMKNAHGTQLGDPYKFGQAMVEIASMDIPPTIFTAGSDALAWIRPHVEERLQKLDAYKDLSCSTDGNF